MDKINIIDIFNIIGFIVFLIIYLYINVVGKDDLQKKRSSFYNRINISFKGENISNYIDPISYISEALLVLLIILGSFWKNTALNIFFILELTKVLYKNRGNKNKQIKGLKFHFISFFALYIINTLKDYNNTNKELITLFVKNLKMVITLSFLFLFIKIFIKYKGKIILKYKKNRKKIVSVILVIIFFLIFIATFIIIGFFDIEDNEKWQNINIPILTLLLGFLTQIFLYKKDEYRKVTNSAMTVLLKIDSMVKYLQLYESTRKEDTNKIKRFLPIKVMEYDINTMDKDLENLSYELKSDELKNIRIFLFNFESLINVYLKKLNNHSITRVRSIEYKENNKKVVIPYKINNRISNKDHIIETSQVLLENIEGDYLKEDIEDLKDALSYLKILSGLCEIDYKMFYEIKEN